MKERNAHLSQDKIAEVAASLFANKGFVGTTMRDVSKALNVSIASVYYHFKNKEDILFHIINSIGEELLSALRRAKDKTNDPLDQLCNMLLAHAKLTEEKRRVGKGLRGRAAQPLKKIMEIHIQATSQDLRCLQGASKEVGKIWTHS